MDQATEIVPVEQWTGPQWANTGRLYKNPVDGRTKWNWTFTRPDGNGESTSWIDTDPWKSTNAVVFVREVRRSDHPMLPK